ncbi:MAG: hypothetical protein ACI865_000320 [Flavobacteriaceae bacterium]|jgi:hypothetical protein
MRAISIIIFLSIINFISAQNLTVELSGQLKNRETGKNINVIVKKIWRALDGNDHLKKWKVYAECSRQGR